MAEESEKELRDKRLQFQNELLRRLDEIGSAPILFVGAGMSRRYLGMPAWEGLIEKLASKTSKDLSYYRTRANGDLATMASLLKEPFDELIYNDEHTDFKLQNAEHLLKSDSALKLFAAAQIIESSKVTQNTKLLEEMDAFKSVVVDAIITTNFDTTLEELFPDYEVYVGQDELVFSTTQGVGEIYKIHGTVTNPNSLVLTGEDYSDFNDRNSYLAAKLLTMFAEHPIIFLGYSMSDSNVLQILESLVRCLKPEHTDKLQHRLFFIQRAKSGNDYQVGDTVTTVDGVSIPVVTAYVPDEFKSLYEVLSGLDRKFPAKTLRLLKDRVYDLVLNNDPKSQIVVTDIDNESDKFEVVMGVGAISKVGLNGYKGISRETLVKDVLHDQGFDSKEIVLSTLPDMLSLPGNIPMVKFLQKSGYINDDGKLRNTEQLDEKVVTRFNKGIDLFMPSKSSMRRALQKVQGAKSVNELFEKLDATDFLAYVGALNEKYLKADELFQRLTELEDEYLSDWKNPRTSSYVKAICLYDWLKHMHIKID